ncbi:glycoside hydrolase family 43 protein [Microbacterium aoyamense]|uniref:Glycoside hydrolase family 43 protein n=1 Tax=Microbacterium aoyamense TaxID=344166 RepID=A0ABP5AMK3_9MICO|nr:glycoside hydrolase family 43 protein [Microbacterium aoyamense]
MGLSNPILRGVHPDPSICRVGDAYYLATSSFAMHPGIPIHRSRDLSTWELIGHVLTGDSWIPLEGFDSSDGVWAPTIRHHDGVFYVVFTLAHGRTGASTYVCTATDPAGPWTRDAITGAEGIDPSLFFDDDGTCWFSAARDAVDPGAYGPGEIWVQQFDLATSALVGPRRAVWHGALARTWVEAPHIYKANGEYHLIAAEGGTEYNHSITAARAPHPLGPYTTDPRSPLLTHRHLGRDSPIQNVGHGDVVWSPEGTPWGVALGVRPVDGHHTLGRETFLVPMSWDGDGPVFAPGEGAIVMDADDDVDPIEPAWVALRGPVDARVDAGEIILGASPLTLAQTGTPSFLGVRQTMRTSTFEATVDPPTVEGQRLGIFAFQNEKYHVGVVAMGRDGDTVVQIIAVSAGTETVLDEGTLAGSVRMRITTAPTTYLFEATGGGGERVSASIPHTALSTETGGGFVGVLIGPWHGGTTGDDPAVFSDVSYRSGTDDANA